MIVYGQDIALGIDISEQRISLALLKVARNGIKVVKAAEAPVPNGAITDGNITNPVLLGVAVRKLLKQNKIRYRQAAVSLVAKPVLTQIVELPENLPGNMNQFVHSEIRHSPVLTGRESQYDYCGLKGAGQSGWGRIFVAAADREKVLDTLKTFSIAGVEVLAIESPSISAVRTVYGKRIYNQYDCNVLVAILHGSGMTICVYRKDELDFIRYVDLDAETDDPDEHTKRCEQEINAVIQYYDLEVDSGEAKWQILAILENPDIERANLESLLQKRFGSEAQVCSPATTYTDSDILKNDKIERCPVTAAGLAMRSLPHPRRDFSVNLVPPEAEEVRATKKFALILANLAALVLLCTFVLAGILRIKLGRTQIMMEQRKKDGTRSNIEQLLNSQRRVNMQIVHLTGKKGRMSEVFDVGEYYRWPDILEDVRKNTPTSLYITSISNTEGAGLFIEGNALAFKSIHVFAELLSQSKHIKSAVVAQTQKNFDVEGMVTYSIACELAGDTGDKG